MKKTKWNVRLGTSKGTRTDLEEACQHALTWREEEEGRRSYYEAARRQRESLFKSSFTGGTAE